MWKLKQKRKSLFTCDIYSIHQLGKRMLSLQGCPLTTEQDQAESIVDGRITVIMHPPFEFPDGHQDGGGEDVGLEGARNLARHRIIGDLKLVVQQFFATSYTNINVKIWCQRH